MVAGDGGDCPGHVDVVTDENGRLASRYGLRQPNDEGPPVDYAVVDEQRCIRYRTLDPALHEELDEVETIVEAAA